MNKSQALNWLRWFSIALTVVAGSCFLWLGQSSHSQRAGHDAIQDSRLTNFNGDLSECISISDRDRSFGTKHRNIEDLRVGDRVLARNPDVSQVERKSRIEPEWGSWLHLSLEMPKSDGNLLHIEILRPEHWFMDRVNFVFEERESDSVAIDDSRSESLDDLWIDFTSQAVAKPQIPLSPMRNWLKEFLFAEQQASMNGLGLAGVCIELDLPELGASGLAWLTDVKESLPIESGDGEVITATFRHPPSTQVIDVKFQHESSAIGVTDNHLFWNVDNETFVAIGELEAGDTVQTWQGETNRIESKLPRPGPESVYNIEVWGEHVYFIGTEGLLAHNMCANDILTNTVVDASSHNKRALAQFEQGFPTGFSGAFNVRTGDFVALPSGSTVLKNGNSPASLVARSGGHIPALNKLDELSQADFNGDTVGFSLLFSKNGQGIVAFNSGGINAHNPRFQGDLVPENIRPQILKSLESALGLQLKSFGNLRPAPSR